MAQSTALTVLTDMAEEQWGLFTRRQAEAAGMAWSTLSRLAAEATLVERVAHGVYRLRGSPPAEHLDLRVAWLQLDPATPAWKRIPEHGAVSHRSAAALYRLGHLPADIHEFTLPTRRQTRRGDVRLHRGPVDTHDLARRDGLPVTRPARIAADLLTAREDPGAVGHVIADALRDGHDAPEEFRRALELHAARFGLERDDGAGLLRWLLDLTDDPRRQDWLADTTSESDPMPL